MSSQLTYALNHLVYDDKLIKRYQMLSTEYARAYLYNQDTITVFIPDNRYIVGFTEISCIVSSEIRPDYIVHNAWQKVTEEARKECQRREIPILTYVQFRELLLRMTTTAE